MATWWIFVLTLGLAADPLTVIQGSKVPRTQASAPEAAVAGQTTPFVFSSVSFGAAEEQRAIFDPMRLMLAQHLQRSVQYILSPTYQDLMDKLRQGQIDMAFMGALTYVDARKAGAVDVLVRAVRRGTTHYRGAWFVRQSSPITHLGQLKGKTLAVVDPSSASGYLFPIALLQQHGIQAATDSQLIVLGSHHGVMEALLKDRVDGAASYQDAAEWITGEIPIRSLAQTEWIPTDPVVARRSIVQTMGGPLRQFLLALREKPQGKAFLEAMGIDGYVVGSNPDYDEFAAQVGRLRRP